MFCVVVYCLFFIISFFPSKHKIFFHFCFIIYFLNNNLYGDEMNNKNKHNITLDNIYLYDGDICTKMNEKVSLHE